MAFPSKWFSLSCVLRESDISALISTAWSSCTNTVIRAATPVVMRGIARGATSTIQSGPVISVSPQGRQNLPRALCARKSTAVQHSGKLHGHFRVSSQRHQIIHQIIHLAFSVLHPHDLFARSSSHSVTGSGTGPRSEPALTLGHLNTPQINPIACLIALSQNRIIERSS